MSTLADDKRPLIIAVDFDGTIVEHQFPVIGPVVPGALEWLKQFQEAGAKLILYTMRSGRHLNEAMDWTRERGVQWWGVNRNPQQEEWTSSPKVYAHVYIDDAAACMPLVFNPKGRPYVAWSYVGPMVMSLLKPGPLGTMEHIVATAKDPLCPKCGAGMVHNPQHSDTNVQLRYMWRCVCCDHQEVIPPAESKPQCSACKGTGVCNNPAGQTWICRACGGVGGHEEGCGGDKPQPASEPHPATCKCGGTGWVRGRELDNADEVTAADTMTRYPCDGLPTSEACEGKLEAVEAAAVKRSQEWRKNNPNCTCLDGREKSCPIHGQPSPREASSEDKPHGVRWWKDRDPKFNWRWRFDGEWMFLITPDRPIERSSYSTKHPPSDMDHPEITDPQEIARLEAEWQKGQGK